MPEEFLRWLVPIAATAAVSTIVPLLINKTIKRNLKAHEDSKTLEAKRVEEERAVQLDRLLNEKLDPIKKEIAAVKEEVTKNKEGTVTLLRERMEQSHDRFIRKKYITSSELANWRHLYKTYEASGGNHFKEYVEEWKNDVENLPREINRKE